jgi:hypothetical protein
MTLGDGQFIDSKVLYGISIQTIPIKLFIITRPIDFYDDEDALKGLKSMTISRNIAKEKVVSNYTENYVLMLDSDVVLNYKKIVETMINFLDKNPKVGACAINTKNYLFNFDDAEKNHLNTACMLIRTNILKQLTFRNTDHNVCNCAYLTKDIYNLGYECKYIRDIRVFEIERKRHFI